MSAKLLIAQFFGTKLTLGPEKKEIKIHQLSSLTPLSVLTEHSNDGFRIASKNELELFAREYPLSRWHQGVVGIGLPVASPKLGVLAKVYRVRGSWVEDVGDDLEWELRSRTIVLLVRDNFSLH